MQLDTVSGVFGFGYASIEELMATGLTIAGFILILREAITKASAGVDGYTIEKEIANVLS
jgi:hypothetical protein